jgi:hypothetical protein
MKCPKCGYNSFEFLDNCKKCGAESVSFKKNMRIKPIVFPSGGNTIAAPLFTDDAEFDDTASQASSCAAEESFSWEPASADDTIQNNKPFDGFDLDFIKTDTDTIAPDFSFDEDPPAEIQAESKAETAGDLDGFSFDETVEPAVESDERSLFAGYEQEFTGAEDMESSFEPDGGSFGETGVKGEISPEQLMGRDQESSATGEADLFAPSAERSEHIFELDELLGEDEVKASEKEDPANRSSMDSLDFDKEFESIFTTGITADSEAKQR